VVRHTHHDDVAAAKITAARSVAGDQAANNQLPTVQAAVGGCSA
jgi:hypothetical protein